MKKMIFGGLLFIGGLIGTLGLSITAAFNPWDYNGITGLLGSLLGTGVILPFVVFSLLMFVGIIVCFCEAYLRK